MNAYADGYRSMQPIGQDAKRVKAFNEGYYQRMADRITENEGLEKEKKAQKEVARQEKELTKQAKREEKQRRKGGAQSESGGRSSESKESVEAKDLQFRNEIGQRD